MPKEFLDSQNGGVEKRIGYGKFIYKYTEMTYERDYVRISK